ncbi:HprK-related kinase B [Aestuariispira insulae]|uniref:HprK-related kinase B n=1 Tax=Aestuariispira insulae TaxID=1461337 RepID=A0A3D9H8I4_9PROT|nr:HprK-related kinase B [Aestuariispira insulae]RED45803.1 HprK-related kinase B [Aestuariispira insulae]
MKVIEAAERLINGRELIEGSVTLDLDGFTVAVYSNDERMLERLGIYFSSVLGAGEPDVEILVLEGAVPELELAFADWSREPGKTGRKDAIADLEDGRILRKVRTGMTFLQSRSHLIAAGACLANDNQVINFILNQQMSHIQNHGGLICHASGLVRQGRGLGIAGFSGGGKSTLMLKMMEQDDVDFLTNDRLFLTPEAGAVTAHGIAKMPRVNPGTLLNSDRLRTLLGEERCRELDSLPVSALWDLEEKYDVDIEDFYGEGRIAARAPFGAFLILNWKRDGMEDCEIAPVELDERPDLLPAVMKSPGPFHQDTEGRFLEDGAVLDPAPYLACLTNRPIFEATGKVDFDAAVRFIQAMKL